VTEDPDGFVHTGVVLRAIDPAIYVSVSQVRVMADLIGCATPQEKQELEGRVSELEQELEDLRADLKQADYQLNAIDILKNAGFETKKRAGRPPKGAKAA
jgi:Tfp pilus assembly protein FimV